MSDPYHTRFLIWSTRNPINVRNATFALTDKFKFSVCDYETTFICKDCRLEDVYLCIKSFGNWKKNIYQQILENHLNQLPILYEQI